VERLITSLLAREGWSAGHGGNTSAPKAATARQKPQEPAYSDDGEPCCPKHKRPLREGKFGLYCPAKDESGKNGYCEYRHSA
jgi:hypothetical protein